MLDSIYHMTLNYLKMMVWCKNVEIFPILSDVVIGVIS